MTEPHLIDTICQVLAPKRSEEITYAFLEHFLPEHETLSVDHLSHPEGKQFASERVMVKYFIESENMSATFYWNSLKPTPHKLMAGAICTSDNHLILTLTLDGPGNLADKYLTEMKSFLSSQIGGISYAIPANSETASEFKSQFLERINS